MISLKPEVISTFSGFSFTDSMAATLVTDVVILVLLVLLNRKISLNPGGLQNIVESVIEYFHDLTEQISGNRTEAIFPWFASFFIFIFLSNILGLLPGFGTIFFKGGGHEHIPLLRASTSDLNTTVALAAVSLGATHVLSIRYIGIRDYLKRFLSINPILLFVGMLELVSEATKLLSLSFRLFGNIFAGEVVLSTISSLGAFLQPVPFLMLETIVALIQALVFAMLTMVFMSIMTTAHEH